MKALGISVLASLRARPMRNRPERSADELRALSAPPAGHPRHPAALDYPVATTSARGDRLRRFLDTWRAARDEVPT